MSVHDSAPEGRGRNFYRDDKALQAILDRLLDSRERGAAEPLLQRMGELAGGEIDRQAEYTDRQARPVLETYNRQGDVVNHVLYNPLYEESARQVYGLGIVGCNYGADRLRYAVHHAPPLPAQRVGPRTRLPGDA
jgi:acyl-CoA dehydrogenase